MDIFQSTTNPFDEFMKGVEGFSISFNTFISIFFISIRYIFGAILIILGVLTIYRSRISPYFKEKQYSPQYKKNGEKFRKSGIILAVFYINIGFGIIFTYFTLLLVILLDPIPDRLIFSLFMNSSVIDPSKVYNFSDINSISEPFDKSLYFILSIGSFLSILDIVLSLWIIFNKSHSNLRTQIILLIIGIIGCFLTGFTTAFMLFL
ncbi:MAG: hypothetical protein JW891_14710 [Candidatus Lokiarchaeota archaeon]|nr:hypothetical protein [Candidatus Lokiarchaeota archaeon]